MENPVDILQKSVEILNKATVEDTNQNYEEALRYYVQGVVLLLHVAKYNVDSEKAKYLIEEKCEQYISRIKKLKDYRNKIHGAGMNLDTLETMLSDNDVLYEVTEIICMCGDYMEFVDK